MTGGAGFVGGHIVDTLLSLGASVVIIDDLSNSTLDHVAELLELEPDRVRMVQGSILDRAALEDAVDGSAYVFHAAAVCSVPRSIEDPERSWVVNADGTLRVLRAAHGAGVKRVVYSASSSAYGNGTGLPKREDMLPGPITPYGASKLAGEHLLASFADSFGLSTVSLRYFNVFGPRQRADSPYSGVIPVFVSAALTGKRPRIHGDGNQTRDFTHVANAVLANLLAATSDRAMAGQVFNVGGGGSVTINELARRVLDTLGRSDIEPEHGEPRLGDVLHSQADISAAIEQLGYRPVVPFEEGLAETSEWYARQARVARSPESGAATR